jgi:hypothetical protein
MAASGLAGCISALSSFRLPPIAGDDFFGEAPHPIAIGGANRKDDVSNAGGHVSVELPVRAAERKGAAQEDPFLDGCRVAPDAPAVLLEQHDLGAQDLGRTERIPHLRMARDDAQRNLFAARADEYRRMRLLQRFGIEARILQFKILAVEIRPLLRPQQLDQLERLVEPAQALANGVERNAVFLMFQARTSPRPTSESAARC